MPSELFVDGSLLDRGNREAVKQMADLASHRLVEIRRAAEVRHDDALDWLEGALAAIAAGEDPNQAFGWSQDRRGTPAGNHSLRDWDIRTTVRDRMRATDESKTVACENVSSECGGEFLLKAERIKEICRGITKDSDIPYPENPFPADPEPYRLE